MFGRGICGRYQLRRNISLVISEGNLGFIQPMPTFFKIYIKRPKKTGAVMVVIVW
jgi:hypothetical protein